jgi:hypothetical protein
MSASIDLMRGVPLLVRRPGRVLTFLAALVGAVLYVWYASVRSVPSVRRRKAAFRARRALKGGGQTPGV